MIRRVIVSAAVLVIISGSSAMANPAMMQGRMSSAGTAASPAVGEPITGKILQTMNSGGYSYVLVKKENGDKIWLAVPQTQLTVGDQMTFGGGMEMVNFESSTLKKKFDRIIFSEGPVKGSKSATEPKKSPGSKGATGKADEKISVQKAEGPNGYTVAEIFKQKAKLNKKTVAVRGKVVKVSTGIMDRNWIHIQDGTGKKGSNNLVVTSQSVPLIGEVVTATGTLAKDKDFGGGYKYEVIVEKADIVTQ